jgi:hypothetical protein
MGIVDYIALAAIVLIVGAAVFYIVRAKRRGEKCVGCPYAKQCGGTCSGGCANGTKEKDNEHN